MWYCIIGTDNPDSLDKRKAARPAHVARLVVLKDQDRLKLAGPFPAIDSQEPGAAGFTGSLIVAEFDNLQAARAWADTDPYVGAGVYADVVVRPFKIALP